MTGARWAQITSVFRAALEKPADERAAYLEQACSGDEPLRRNVERLLAGEAEPTLASPVPEFLEGGALELGSGETLAQYRVEAKIGEGGMGAVYRAYDTRLQRKVALKVLSPEHFANPDRKRRLIEEARAASGLNHPNIITIYEIGLDRGVDFIAMEYVEGKRLDELIPAKGMRAAQLLRYAVQASDGLAKAHGAGILHRDLKPSNMMVTEEGRLKILDFGLAKVLEPPPTSPDAATATMRLRTEEGTVAGTAAYMSPEQAEGRKLDMRSDIFSFGSVLYEMATGQRPFAADSRLALLTKIVNDDPQPPGQIAPLPPDLEKLILRCLRKDAARRYQTTADLKVALEDLQTETSLPQVQSSMTQAPKAGGSGRMRMVAVLAAVAALAIIAVLGLRAFRSPAEAGVARTVKFTITPTQLSKGSTRDIDTAVFLSPDGSHIAYIESPGGQIWVRDMDQEKAHPVPGATGAYEAFWSPDNQFIGYSTGFACPDRGGCDLLRIPAQGGTPVVITKINGQFKRASWSSDGETIVFADNGGLSTVPARGGLPTRVLDHPHIEHPSILDLPGKRRAFLFQAMDPDRPGGHGIYIQVPGEDRHRFLALSTSTNPYPAYSPTGHIIYTDGNFESAAVWALPFSLNTLQATAKAFPVAQHGASPRVSHTGTLVYSDVPTNHMQLVWCDRSGKVLSPIGEPIRQESLALSPDGHRLAVVNRESAPDIWVYDLERGIKTRFTFDSAEMISAWTGDRITYSSARSGSFDLFSKPASGSGEAKVLVSTPLAEFFADWSPDQRFLIYTANGGGAKGHLLYRERRPDGSLGDAVVFRKTGFTERFPRFSPDGRFVVYVSDESGKDEVYVRDFPNGAGQWQISATGGTAPRWSRDGKEIFYVERGKLMAVSVTSRPAFTVGTAALLFGNRPLGAGYDVSSDGRRFVVLERPAEEPPLAIHVVHNWFEEFRGQQRGQ